MREIIKLPMLLFVGGLVVAVIGYWLLVNAAPWENDPIRQYWPAFFQLLGVVIVGTGIVVGVFNRLKERPD